MALNVQIFEKIESQVRSYCRTFPDVFHRAKGAEMFTESGKAYLDFFAGAGTLNYGHNPDPIKREILAYLSQDRIMHGLDLYTTAKRDFLETFDAMVLTPQNLPYRVQFPGPTGTNAVEAALKLARKATGRNGVFAFMGGYHGMTLGALAATGNRDHRKGSSLPLSGVTFMPYPHGFMAQMDTLRYLEEVLTDTHSGIDLPAAVLLETVQAEGGVVVAPIEWLQGLRALCDRFGVLMIVDDIQVGCGRTGPFFSFQRAAMVPDMVTLSKSISGYGLPLSLTLMKPELDLWSPAEHNGTFRGNQLAFVGGKAALEMRQALNLEASTKAKGRYVATFLEERIQPMDERLGVRGLGLIWGIDLTGLEDFSLAKRVTDLCFERGLIIERAGRNDQVIKILPPLTIDQQQLETGCDILAESMRHVLGSHA